MKNTEYPRPKIRGEEGKVQWTAGLFFLLFIAILLCAYLQMDGYRMTSLYLEDALAASNLASAVIDIQEYGVSHTVQISDPTEAYALYVEALRGNLGLDDNWECANRSLISGPVTVEDYTIYNVRGDHIAIWHRKDNGQSWEEEGMVGEVYAPDGSLVESTGVYSQISFEVKGFLGVTVTACKGKLADIAIN
ncbi:MAG: hypothetical protein NC417_09645 [Candidatus Gastranaerophilales bacterium]|nr:hypothetical protein [Candidatus Gastranaerophilales bacterium]